MKRPASSSGAGRFLFLAVAGLLVLLGTGCQVVLTAGVDVGRDGSGIVRAGIGLDDDALARLGDPATELRLADLRQAGWTVTGPAKEKDGLTWVRATKRFSDAAGAAGVAAELSGPDGPFRSFQVVRTRGFLHTSTRFTGVVDLTKGLAGFSDPDLAAKLGGALGLDADALRARLGADADKELQVRVEAHLPGDTKSNATSRGAGGTLVWQPALGKQLAVDARSSALNLVPLVPAVVALVFAAAAVVAAGLHRPRRPT